MEPITTIGRILKTEQQRDAIHMAIMPVTAGERLSPGEHVGMLPDGTVGNCDKPLGIIDPFLTVKLKKGDQCWMFLYPNTITSLRHEWTHPEINGPQPSIPDAAKNESERWLRDFADRLFSYYGNDDEDGSRFDLLIADAEEGYFATDIEYGADLTPDETFWMHFERYTGRKVKNRPTYFRCSC